MRRLLVRARKLTPGDGHGAQERAGKTTKEHHWRNGDWNPRDRQRHQRRPERQQVEDRRDNDRMGVAEAQVIQNKSAYPDRENNGESNVVGRLREQRDEVPPAGRTETQQGDREQQRNLGQADELKRAELSRREKRERLLHRIEARGDERVEAAQTIVDGGGGSAHRGSPVSPYGKPPPGPILFMRQVRGAVSAIGRLIEEGRRAAGGAETAVRLTARARRVLAGPWSGKAPTAPPAVAATSTKRRRGSRRPAQARQRTPSSARSLSP